MRAETHSHGSGGIGPCTAPRKIGPGAETTPSAGYHHRPAVVILVQFRESAGEHVQHIVVEAVHDIRPVKGNDLYLVFTSE